MMRSGNNVADIRAIIVEGNAITPFSLSSDECRYLSLTRDIQ
jgi:hypothetical protein